MRRTRAQSAVAVVVALLIAGCAGDSGPTGDDTPTSVPSETTEPIESSEPTEPSEPSEPSEPTGPGTGELVGIPEPGVESGCWLLDGHLLLGVAEDLVSSGQRVRVTGRVERDVATTCQQGIPFRVETVEPLE